MGGVPYIRLQVVGGCVREVLHFLHHVKALCQRCFRVPAPATCFPCDYPALRARISPRPVRSSSRDTRDRSEERERKRHHKERIQQQQAFRSTGCRGGNWQVDQQVGDPERVRQRGTPQGRCWDQCRERNEHQPRARLPLKVQRHVRSVHRVGRSVQYLLRIRSGGLQQSG